MSAATPLLERETGGVRVTLAYWDGENGLADPAVILTVDNGQITASVPVPPEKARDAFDHPSVYLSDPLELFS